MVDFRYRNENAETLLAFNVTTSEIIFIRGNSKEYIESILNEEPYRGSINNKNIELLKRKGIIVGE